VVFKTQINWPESIDHVVSMCKTGATYQEIADHYGVSRERIRQVLRRYAHEWSNGRMQELRNENKRTAEAELFYNKWGKKSHTDLYKEQRSKFRAKKYNCKNTVHEWSLEFGDFEWPTHCPMLGIPIDYFAKEGRVEGSPSFDRIDNSKGYVKGNIQIISWRANRIKNDGTAAEHRAIAEAIDKRDMEISLQLQPEVV